AQSWRTLPLPSQGVGGRPPAAKLRPMARRKKKRTLRPRLPARIKKKKGKPKSEQHHELMGLALVALGLFLASILYLGWNGGTVGGAVAGGFKAVIGGAAYAAPIVFLSAAPAGALVRRSGHAVKRAHPRARRARRYEPLASHAPVIPLRQEHEPPVDAVHEFPDVVGETHQPAPLLVRPEVDEDDPDQP